MQTTSFLLLRARIAPALVAAPAFLWASAASADGGASVPVALLSRLHIPLLHFPIALLVVALVVEVWGRTLARGALADASRRGAVVGTLLGVAALAAVIVSASGLALFSVEEFQGRALRQAVRHRNIGLGTTVLAVVAAIAHSRARPSLLGSKPGLFGRLALPSLALAAAGVVVTGHWGGGLVHGDDYYARALSLQSGGSRVADGGGPRYGSDGEEGSDESRNRWPEGTIPDKPDYQTHIAPLFERSCNKCHGPEKRKAGLRLDTKRFAMRGGETGPSIVPGNADKSLVYTMSAKSPDDDDVMPEKGKLLALSELETLKRWIEQGAVWPD
jgi:uncharacterized membrane protein